MRPLALAALLSLPLFADESVADLIAGLRHDDASRRDACEEALGKRWDEAKAGLEAARDAEKDAEARARIERILARGPEALWVETVAAAFEKAETTGRPVLVIRGDGPREKQDTMEGRHFRHAFETPECAEALRGMIAVWQAEKGVPGATDAIMKSGLMAEGWGGIEMYVATPKKGICHYLRGWWSKERLAGELARGKEFAATPDRPSLDKARASAFEALKQAFEESGCANARRHLHPWNCNGEGCVIRRLGLCYVQGDTMIGDDLRHGLPDPMAGGMDAKLPF
jgi:hypothetical protein